ncbi:hypothetical protein SDC9_68326 [bioreactor metagenome]|uniref:SLH domain-containing protein n=1 Tax=bioreactor metagenome TaxID=1076179 RepID=A0A644Y052_9ZZZZ
MGYYHITAEYMNKYSFTVTYSAGANGTLTAAKDGVDLTSGGIVPINSSVTFTATPKAYYTVKGWKVDGLPYEETPGTAYKEPTLTLSGITANRTVSVEFVGAPVTVTYVVGISSGSSAPHGNLALFYSGTLASVTPVTGSDNSLTYEKTVPATGEVNILANPDAGYQVKCWYVWDGEAETYTAVSASAEVANYNIPAITGSIKVKVEFEKIPTYDVLVSSDSYENGGGTVRSGSYLVGVSGMEKIQVKRHGNLTLLATPETGSYLYEWRIEGADYVTDGNSVTLTNLTGEATVAAVFRKAFYDVSLDSGEGGSMTAHFSLSADKSSGDIGKNGSASIKSGSTVTASIVPASGNTIDTLTVNGKSADYKVSGNAVDGYSYTYEIPELFSDTEIAVTFKECVFHTVTAPNAGNFDLLISVGDPEDENDDVYASGGTADAGFVADGFSHMDGAQAAILEGGEATLAFTPASGTTPDYACRVDTSRLCDEVEAVLEDADSDASYSIYLDGASYVVKLSGIDTPLDFSALDDVFVLRTDDVDEYTVTFGKNGSGTVTATYGGMQLLSGTKIPKGSSVTFKLTPQEHYALTKLLDGSESVLNYVDAGKYKVDVEDDIDLSATFEIAEYPVTILKLGTGSGTVTATGDGDTLTASGYLPVGCEVSISADGNSDSAFNCMSVGSTPVANNVYTIASLDGPVTITAVFDAVSKAVTMNSPANGKLKVTDSQGNIVTNGQSVAVGTVLIITATPDAHYVLASLTAGGSSITGNTYSVDAAKTNLIEARFKLAEVMVTISDTENGTIKVSDRDGNVLSSGSYVAVGSQIKVETAPRSTNYELESLKMNDTNIASGSLYTVPAKDVTLSATFKFIGDAPPPEDDNGGGSGGGGGGGSTVIINDLGVALAALESIDVFTTDNGLTALGMVTTADSEILTAVEGKSFASLADYAKTKDTGITFKTDFATITFDNKAVAYINGFASSEDVILTVRKVDPAKLSAENRQTVGNHTVYELALTAGDAKVNTFGEGKAKISIPYTLKTGETAETVVAYYIDAAGTLKTIRGAYHANTGTLDFPTTHFSYFSMGNNPVNFSDVAANAWYYKPVSFVAARGITLGIGGGLFGPDRQITRGEFIVMLMRAYGIEPDSAPIDNFADAGSDYYTNYLAAAKRLGITKGIGDNLYAPASYISRQDIFTLLYRALDVLGELPAKTKTVDLSTFSDYGSISDYALTAVKTFVEAGVVSGSDGKLSPTSLSTRAQMAQVLYNLLAR